MPDPAPSEDFPYPTTTRLAAATARSAHAGGARATSRPNCAHGDAYANELGREPTPAEWTRFSIVFDRALLAMETAPAGAVVWDDENERFVQPTGREIGEAVGLAFLGVRPKADR